MKINITILAELDQFPLSHSRAEGGENAGRNTWQASLERAEDIQLLTTPEELETFREWVGESGGWTREEIDAWNVQECNALFLQWIAGDCRELGADSLDEIDWDEAENLQSEGQAPSNLFRAESGEVYFSLSR